jgi:hypothetical protein
MTTTILLLRLFALEVKRRAAHRRLVEAVGATDVVTIVETSREQGALWTEQIGLVADHVAATVTSTPQPFTSAERAHIHDLARELREPQRGRARAGTRRSPPLERLRTLQAEFSVEHLRSVAALQADDVGTAQRAGARQVDIVAEIVDAIDAYVAGRRAAGPSDAAPPPRPGGH